MHIDLLVRNRFVDFLQHAGDILVDMQDAVGIPMKGQAQSGKIDGAFSTPAVAVTRQLATYFPADIFLSFQGGSPNMRS